MEQAPQGGEREQSQMSRLKNKRLRSADLDMSHISKVAGGPGSVMSMGDGGMSPMSQVPQGDQEGELELAKTLFRIFKVENEAQGFKVVNMLEIFTALILLADFSS
jgi:hypothetical protein